MRRFIAFIVLALSLLGIVLFNTQAAIEKVNWSQEFDRGTEVVYNITPGEGSSSNIDMNSLMEIMGNRLEKAGATNYTLEAAIDEGNRYEVRIVLGSRHHSNVENILRSTMTSGEFSIFTTDGTRGTSGDEAIKRGSAEVFYDNNHQAYVRVEVGSEVKNVEEEATGEDGDQLLVLWQGKTEGLDYSDLADVDYIYTDSSGEQRTGEQLKSKVLAVINLGDVTSEDGSVTSDNNNFIYDEDENKYYLTFDSYGYAANAGSGNRFDANSAHSFERIFNSEFLDYEITEIYRGVIDASYGAGASTLMIWSTVLAVVLVCVYLIVCYGLLAISGCIGIGLTVLMELLILNFFNIQVGPTMIIALIASMAMSVSMLCLYYRRTREEVYRGRSIAKASNEGFRKAVSTAIDSTILLASLGIVLALISREGVKSFFIFLLISSIANVLLVFLLGKVLNNFLLNSDRSSHLKLFRMKEEYVVDLNGEAKEKIPDTPAQKIDVRGAKKKTAIASVIGIAVATAAFAGFGIFSDVFNFTNQDTYGRIEIRSGETTLFEKLPEGVQGKDDYIAIDNFIVYLESLDESIEVRRAWVVTDQVNPFEEDKNYIYFYADLEKPLSVESDAYEKLSEYVRSVDGEYDMVNAYVVHPGVVMGDFTNTLVLMSVTVGITLLYFLIRYRYSLAISEFATMTVGTFISLGILSLTRLQVGAYAGIGALTGMLMTALLLIPLSNRLGQLKNESKVKVTTYEQREEIAYATLRSSSTQFVLSVVGFVALFLVLIAISPFDMAPIYLAAAISLLINGVLALFAVIPLHLWIERHLKFTRAKSKRAEMRKAKRERIAKANRNRGAEPEENIIPGIND